MKLLFLTPQLPFPPHQGTTLRNYNLIRYLAQNHSITLISFGTRAELESENALRGICKRIVTSEPPRRSLFQRLISTFVTPQPDMALRLASSEMLARVRDVLRADPADWAQVEGIEMAPYLGQLGRLPCLFDDHNAEYALQKTAFQSDAQSPRRWHSALYSFIQWQKLARYERRMCLDSRAVVAVSQKDADALRLLDERIQPVVIPNGVDIEYFRPNDVDSNQLSLVFTGKMDYRPNIDAMVWFCEEIFPRLVTEVSKVRLEIVGQKPTTQIMGLAREGQIHVTGRVDDTRPFVSKAAVYVAPLRMGSGTRLKILEAMAMGKAIVSTTRGAEGIEVQGGRDLLLADSPSEFADAIVSLFHDSTQRHRIGLNARRVAEEKYAWGKIVPKFEEIYQNPKI